MREAAPPGPNLSSLQAPGDRLVRRLVGWRLVRSVHPAWLVGWWLVRSVGGRLQFSMVGGRSALLVNRIMKKSCWSGGRWVD